ncbi:MAG: NADH-quinone oxidoreductase subunit F [Xanthobacteraceae bacterium]|nr:MAG: NADH-quinone oxidoreductase subunit F [Xanthobacteraceae bacterium]
MSDRDSSREDGRASQAGPDAGWAGRGKAATKTRGRPLDHDALAEVVALTGEAPQRDRLIEHLHQLQDRHGHLSARHMRALADLLRVGQAEIFEVASFYHHFDIVKEGDTPPPPVTVRVCNSLPCRIAGAEALLADLIHRTEGAPVRIQPVPCVGRCAEAPVAVVTRHPVGNATPETVIAALQAGLREDRLSPLAIGLAAYRAAGGYQLLEAVRAHPERLKDVIAAISDAGLRGLGGAGFPAGRKWQIVRGFPAPRYMTVNADEGEPGTFKDRHHLERDPHRFLEGCLIAAEAVAAERIVIYLRDEYAGVRLLLAREIAALEDAGLAKPGLIDLRRGAGAYVCGEESAMLESIEGKRGLPRLRPPYIAEHGLFGRPTLNHNVETLYWIRDIVERGADWFARQGMNGAKGLRSWSVSGRVQHPGVVVAPAGITAAELIARAGGMAEGHRLKAYLPGGASGGILPASLAHLPLDFGTLAEHGCFVGSHALIVLSDQDDIGKAALNLMQFFRHESCGQCTPCRAGTEKAATLMQRPVWDAGLLTELASVMQDASICGLGQAAPNPMLSVLRFFRDEVTGGRA